MLALKLRYIGVGLGRSNRGFVVSGDERIIENGGYAALVGVSPSS